jgi:subtilase family serine protease
VKPPNTNYPYAQKRAHLDDGGRLHSWRLIGSVAQRNSRGWQVLLATALVLFMAGLAAAQGNPVRPRITDRIDETRLIVLQGNTHPLARPQFDQGAAPPNLPMDRMLLILQRSPEQEAALQDLLEQQQTSLSPNHHKWLTPDQFGQQFGPADQDIQVVTSWLTSQGFQGIQVSKGRNVIEFSGTAAQVETALHTAIHKYVVNGENHWANVNDPQIPAALAPVVSGVLSLHNFRKKPLFVRSSQRASATLTPGGRPQITFKDGSHGLAPADFDKIYNIDPTTMTGAGATIAIVASTNINVPDVTTFRTIFGLPTKDSFGILIPQIVVTGPDPGDIGGGAEQEAVLDATWSGAVAPNATVKLVVSADTNSEDGIDLSEVYIIDNNLADILTESVSVCESPQNVSAKGAFYGGMAEQAAAQGITYLVASGDGGPDGCDDPSTVPSPLAAAAVNLIASTPFNVAVGGTQFNDTANPSTYWNSSNGTNSESAISYIPENAWNESCTGTNCGGLGTGLWSSGGGQSTLFLKPPWQTGVTGIPTANWRFLPDVSLTAAGHDGYVLCLTSDGSCQGSNPTFDIFGGTSASAQAFGGIIALVVQKTGSRQGQANFVLYNLAAKEAVAPTLASCNGSNALPSSPPSSTCVFNDTTAGNTNLTGEAGFTAGTGYDEATGLGSVNVTNLVNQWSTAIVTGSTTKLSLNNGAAVNITHGQSVPVSIMVAAASATPPVTAIPSGDVSLIAQIPSTGPGLGADGFTLTNTGSIPAGSTAILLPGSSTPYNVYAHYEGDATFLASNSPTVSVTVNPEASLTSVNIFASGIPVTSVAYGSPYVLAVNVGAVPPTAQCAPNGVGGPACPTGTVTVNDAGTTIGTGAYTLNSEGYVEVKPIQLSAGTHALSAAYTGDNSFFGSTSSSDTVTVVPALTTTSVTANPMSGPSGGSVTLTATVATQSNATASAAQEPTGMVQFYLSGAAFGPQVPVTGGIDPITLFAQATASMTTITLPTGLDQITAQYLGDTNYAASAQSLSVTVNVGTAGINLSSCNTATISIGMPGQSGTCLITVTGANSFAGSVTLACTVTASPAGATDLPTCSFGAPASANFTAPNITLSATAPTGNATMTVASKAYHAAVFRPSNHPFGREWPLAAAGVSLIYFFFLLGVPRRRRWRFAPLAVLLVVVVAAIAGCGGGYGISISGGSDPGTTVGAYTVTVTATPAGGTAQTTAITVNVQ